MNEETALRLEGHLNDLRSVIEEYGWKRNAIPVKLDDALMVLEEQVGRWLADIYEVDLEDDADADH